MSKYGQDKLKTYSTLIDLPHAVCMSLCIALIPIWYSSQCEKTNEIISSVINEFACYEVIKVGECQEQLKLLPYFPITLLLL